MSPIYKCTATSKIVNSTSIMNTLTNLIIFGLFSALNATWNPYYYPNRDGIVHLFEWKFSDIANECENVLASVGYAGVQVLKINH